MTLKTRTDGIPKGIQVPFKSTIADRLIALALVRPEVGFVKAELDAHAKRA